jgi:hypothetical protein
MTTKIPMTVEGSKRLKAELHPLEGPSIVPL